MKHTAGYALALLLVGSGLSFAALSQSTPSDTAADKITIEQTFETLDRNSDGRLSRDEAQADPTIGSVYDSFDTSATLEQHAQDDSPAGITLEQFEAGLQAAASGGTIGAPAAGGETLRLYPDGTIETVEGTGVKSGETR